jgi:hypothetical protein
LPGARAVEPLTAARLDAQRRAAELLPLASAADRELLEARSATQAIEITAHLIS